MSETFLYRIQLTRPELLTEGSTPEEDETGKAHFEYLKDLHEKGVMLHVGRTLTTDPNGFGQAIFLADSEEAAREIMNNDPGVSRGMFRAELFPYRSVFYHEKAAAFSAYPPDSQG